MEKSLIETLRRAIEDSGLTRYEIAKRSGVHKSALSRFVTGERSLSIESIEKIAPVVGVTITARRRNE